MTRLEVYKQIRERLEREHGDRLKGVVIFGSFARGEEGPDSDLDVLVLLEGPVRLMRDIERNIDCLYDLGLELGRSISAKPVDVEKYRRIRCPLYDSAKAEGIAV